MFHKKIALACALFLATLFFRGILFAQDTPSAPSTYTDDEPDKLFKGKSTATEKQSGTKEKLKETEKEKEAVKTETTPEDEILKQQKKSDKWKGALEEAKKFKKIMDEIRPFGYEFFDQSPSSFIPGKDISPPADYNLGPGDELKIVLFSPIGQQDVYTLKIDNEGNIYLPVVGKVNVLGLTRANLETLVLSRLQTHFPQIQGYVTIDHLRTIRVFVTGEAKRPGGYIISGLSTAFNALYVAGGPNKRGSMRNIQLLRNNKLISTVDLYAYLLKGDRSSDVQLQPEDTLFIPVAKNRVTVKGEVNRPAIYELNEKEMELDAALNVSGGLKPTGYSYRIQIERVTENKEKVVLDMNLATEKKAPLLDGDSISVMPVVDLQKNAVWIDGEVERPGKYELKESMRVADLIKEAEGLKKLSEVYTGRADILRNTDKGTIQIVSFNLQKALSGDEKENLKLQPFDMVKIYSVEGAVFVDRTVKIGGAIKNPGTYQRTENMSLRDLINIAGGLLPEALSTAEVARAQGDKDGVIITVALDSADAANTLLEDMDIVSVKTNGDYRRQLGTITLTGEVKYPGVYAIRNINDTLFDVLNRAGGMKENSFPEGAIFKRDLSKISTEEQLAVSQTIQQTLDFLVEQQYNVELAKHGVTPVKSTNEEGIAMPALPVTTEEMQKLSAFTQGTKQVQNLLETPSGLNDEKIKGILEPRKVTLVIPKTRIIVDLAKVLNSQGSAGNIVLRDGDTLFVPKKPLTVSVVGAVLNPGNLIYEEKKKIDDYVSKVGGYSEDANIKRVIVLKPNGETYPRSKVKFIERGDILIIPPKPLVITEKKTWWEKTKDVVKVISDTATAAFIIRSLKQLSTK